MSSLDRDKLDSRLARGISELGLEIDAGIRSRLMDYLALLHKWNGTYNLSGIRDPERMVSLHLLDSLAILPYVGPGNCLDVGTGAGLPGIPLAICRPEQHVTLLDSNGKKTRFLVQAASTLGLDNISVANARIENFQSTRQIDIVLSRAFASLKQTVEWVDHLLPAQGTILAMKGIFPQEELDALPDNYRLAEAFRLVIPGEPGKRQLIRLVRRDLADPPARQNNNTD